jgi:hypothetical protein
MVAMVGLPGCTQQPASPQGDLAGAITKLARTPGRTSASFVESTLALSQKGVELKYPTDWRYVGKANDIVRFDAVRADAPIKDVIIDNIDHGGDPHEQEIRIDFAEGTCLTGEIMRRASGIAPQPYKDDWVPPPHYPLHYYRPATYALEFVIRDRFPADQRKIFLGGEAPCFSVVVVKKYFGGN